MGLFCENVLFQSPEGFLHPVPGQGQVHPQVAGAVEISAVLHRHAYPVAGVQHLIQRFSVGRAPAGWVSATDISLFTGFTNMPQIPTVFNR